MRRALLPFLLVAVAATACSTPVAGTAAPSPQAPPSAAKDLVYQTGFREFTDTLATMRSWDNCAMHDIAAAEAATGGKRQWIVPTNSLNTCQLVLTHGNDDHTWSIDIGTELEPFLARSYESGTVNGTKLYREKAPEPGAVSFGVSCAYFYPVQEPLGIKIDVQTTAKDGRDAVCAVSDKYVTALLPNLKNPPLVSAGRTNPMISQYGKDPCLALRPAQEAQPKDKRGNPTYLSGLNPYTCSLQSDGAMDKTVFTFTTLFDEGGKTTQLAGLKAFVKDSMGDCEYRVPVDPPIRFKPDDPNWPGYEPGMSLKMRSPCNDALADSIVKAANQQPGPSKTAPGQAGVITLGKLTP